MAVHGELSQTETVQADGVVLLHGHLSEQHLARGAGRCAHAPRAGRALLKRLCPQLRTQRRSEHRRLHTHIHGESRIIIFRHASLLHGEE